MNYKIVIPARYASTRLPGKALRDCAGTALLQRVYEQAKKSAAQAVVIATDDSRIEAAALAFGAQVIMTSSQHRSGSDRIAEAVQHLGWTGDCLLVNLQGDEPLMPPACLDQVAVLLHERPDAAVASLWWPVSSADEFTSRNAVKLVHDNTGQALYFSRAPIPGNQRDGSSGWENACRHIGLYAYRVETLQKLTALPAGKLELQEHLEQLRWLEAGFRVVVDRAIEAVPAGVDTEKDLLAVEAVLNKIEGNS